MKHKKSSPTTRFGAGSAPAFVQSQFLSMTAQRGVTTIEEDEPTPRSQGSRRRRLSRYIGLGVVLAALSTGMVATPAAAYTSVRCGFATAIGVRGSLEPAGTGLTNGDRTYRTGGLGNVIRNLATGLENREDVPIYFEALNYPAVIAAPGNEQASNYLASVSLGAKNLILEIKDLGKTCGNRPIVLAGYSQGAEVIKKALTSGSQYGGVQYSLTTTDKARIRSVVMYGAPSYHAGEAWNAAGNGPSNGIFGFGRNSFESYRAMAWLPPSYSTQGWQPVIRSYCLSGDYFCQSNLTQNGKNIHASYPLTPVMNASSVFITDWLVDNTR